MKIVNKLTTCKKVKKSIKKKKKIKISRNNWNFSKTLKRRKLKHKSKKNIIIKAQRALFVNKIFNNYYIQKKNIRNKQIVIKSSFQTRLERKEKRTNSMVGALSNIIEKTNKKIIPVT
jgi:cytidylate kinase